MYLPRPPGTFSQVDLWGHLPRPWVVTLSFTLNNLWLFAYFQVILGIFSWTVLLCSISKIQFFQQEMPINEQNPVFTGISAAPSAGIGPTTCG
jgi:hypothetical protein